MDKVFRRLAEMVTRQQRFAEQLAQHQDATEQARATYGHAKLNRSAINTAQRRTSFFTADFPPENFAETSLAHGLLVLRCERGRKQ
ncbi:hypothetical protein E1301_Tti017766 [Triplophysa tibetana]|uniref:Uncharacterized protein n=1 Tax=Triplophysa tibetana TaxID=1572043 RepID=A0A5A9MUZ8_9TELE|nr:hypothetical protein E1301_Tti017766 [Triplophysa tibetana]